MIKLGLMDIVAWKQDQDSQVIIDALVEQNRALQEENAEKDVALAGAMQRIKGLETIKGMYLGANEALLKENELYKLQEKRLILQLQKRDEQIRELKQNSRAAKYFEMAEENLKLAQEVERLKGDLYERENDLSLS